jgi:hypothetical protein
VRLQCRAYLVCLLSTSPAFGQDEVPATSVGPDDAVITVNGFCPDGAPRDQSCATVISRAHFEQLTEALQPGMTPALRLKVAGAYAQLMRMAAAAEKRGLDKTPAFEQELRYARMQLLAQDLSRALQADADRVNDSELEEHYKKNESSYEQATLARIFIPRARRGVPTPTQHGGADSADGEYPAPSEPDVNAVPESDEEAMMRIAAELRTRAANGADPDELQIEAYKAAGIPGAAPNTKMENVRRASLPPSHEMALDLQPGQVSEVLSDPGGAHFIYKMISRQSAPLAEVKGEIRQQIASRRYHDAIQAFSGDVVLNDAYFASPATPPPHRLRSRREPPAAQASDRE